MYAAGGGEVIPVQLRLPMSPGLIPPLSGDTGYDRAVTELQRELMRLWESRPHALPVPGGVVEQKPGEDDDEAGDDGNGEERPERQRAPRAPRGPEPGVGAGPPPGGMRRATDRELQALAKADGYQSIEAWKQSELQLDRFSDIALDREGELFAIPRRGSGPAQRLDIRIPK